MTELAQRYRVKRMIVLAYHPQANAMIKYRYKLLVDAFSNTSDRESTNWVQDLPTAL